MIEPYQAGKVTIKIENAYSDGHTSEHNVYLDPPLAAEDIDDWFEEIVFEHTGDGHGTSNDLGACYMATIVLAPDPELVGITHEWLA